MKGERIPDNNHIARLCHNKYVNVKDGQIQASAFHLRPSEDGLSVNWLEFLKCSSRDNEITEIRKIYSTFTVGARAKIAVLNVGKVYKKVLLGGISIEILHAPEENDQSHSEMYYSKQDYMEIGELILQTVHETYPART